MRQMATDRAGARENLHQEGAPASGHGRTDGRTEGQGSRGAAWGKPRQRGLGVSEHSPTTGWDQRHHGASSGGGRGSEEGGGPQAREQGQRDQLRTRRHRAPQAPAGALLGRRDPGPPQEHCPGYRDPWDPAGVPPGRRDPQAPAGAPPGCRDPWAPVGAPPGRRDPRAPAGALPGHRAPGASIGAPPGHRDPWTPAGALPGHRAPGAPAGADRKTSCRERV